MSEGPASAIPCPYKVGDRVMRRQLAAHYPDRLDSSAGMSMRTVYVITEIFPASPYQHGHDCRIKTESVPHRYATMWSESLRPILSPEKEEALTLAYEEGLRRTELLALEIKRIAKEYAHLEESAIVVAGFPAWRER